MMTSSRRNSLIGRSSSVSVVSRKMILLVLTSATLLAFVHRSSGDDDKTSTTTTPTTTTTTPTTTTPVITPECFAAMQAVIGYDFSQSNMTSSDDETSIKIDWSASKPQEECGFAVRVWKVAETNTTAMCKLMYNISRTSECTVTDLDSGTLYNIYVTTINCTSSTSPSDTSSPIPSPMSWILQTKTADHTCNCNEIGTVPPHTVCDKVTGQCQCKTDLTIGLNCDRCRADSFWHPGTKEAGDDLKGCMECDNCPHEDTAAPGLSPAGNGSCYYNETETMLCYCMPGYAGKHCRQCAEGFNVVTIEPATEEQLAYVQCVPSPCNCNKEENVTNVQKCYELTGHCKQCVFLAEPSAVCDSCLKESSTWDSACGTKPNSSTIHPFVIILFVMIIIAVIAVFIYFARKRYRRHQQMKGFLAAQMRDRDEDDMVRFSNMMEEPAEHSSFGRPPRKL